jgi:hypothetical protein
MWIQDPLPGMELPYEPCPWCPPREDEAGCPRCPALGADAPAWRFYGTGTMTDLYGSM